MAVRRDARRCAPSAARWTSRDDRGASAVEFALISVLLLAIVYAIMGFGFAMAQQASLASGAREGARYGSTNGVGTAVHTCGAVVDRARQQAQTIGVSETDVGVTVYRVTGGASTTVCSAAVGAATPTGGSAPCANSTATAATEATVRVETTLEDRGKVIPSPIPGGESLLTPDTLEGAGEFRCEYH
jgi:Flp pilus assembly protein TadG